MSIELRLAGNLPHGGAVAGLSVGLPRGTNFVCSSSTCKEDSQSVGLAFKRDGEAIIASAEFFVEARSFGVEYNDVTASAAIPEVVYDGPGTPLLIVSYQIPSASSYDWSSYPASSVDKSGAVWQQALIHGDTVGRVTVGTNYAAQANDDTRTFIAGALLGLAGGALLSAVQEALHAGD